ncbi:SWI5-dependent HO expression protein 4 [Coemansia sp. RSA 2049]|nr:SWI5-dependent HO expression protein 4 [Coemansia sp. RSA 2049]
MEQTVEGITKKLQAGSSNAPMLLLERARLYADNGDEANAKADIASAASLVKEPQHRSDQTVAAVERAFREISIRPAAAEVTESEGKMDPLLVKHSAFSVEELVNVVVKAINDGKQDQDGAVSAAASAALVRKVDGAQGKQAALTGDQICSLVDVFHTAVAAAAATDFLDECVVAKNIAQCVKAAVLHTALDPASKDKEKDSGEHYHTNINTLQKAAKEIQTALDVHDSNGRFKQLACRCGASMYMAVAYSLSTYVDSQKVGDNDDVAKSLRDIYNLYIQQVWMVGTLSTAKSDRAGEVGEVCQGVLRLLTAAKPLFVYLFTAASGSGSNGSGSKKPSKTPVSRLLQMLGVAANSPVPSETKARSHALLIVSQLVAAAKDPANAAMFPEHDASSSRARAQAHSAPSAAVMQLRKEVTGIIDEWIQSTIQLERSRGLLSAASLYEGGVGPDLLSDLWLKSGWAGDLWDQGEFDKPETQLSLLRFADASSTDVSVGKQMKSLGNGLVQELAKRQATSNGGSDVDDELAAAASVVLAKWSGVATASASASAQAPGSEGKTAGADSEMDPAGGNSTTPDIDPMVLANMHMERISDALNTRDSNNNGSADSLDNNIEKAVEALGFLCLKPAVKEHVAHNEGFLKRLFVVGQKTTSMSLRFSILMLIRNLTMYKPVLTEEQKRMQQLQRLGKKAQGEGGSSTDGDKSGAGRTVGDDLKQDDEGEDPELDSIESVSKRSVSVCKCGGVSVLVSTVQPKLRPSDSAKDTVAEIMVALVTTQSLRGLVVQQGGIRALLGILTASAPKADSKTSQSNDGYVPRALLQKRDKNIAFSLAKIAISVPPNLAFQDPREIVLLLLSLLHEDSEPQALLMKFESLLALTNLASMEPGSSYDVRDYMAISLNGVSSIEMLMLSDHPLVRRAATELLCNLVYSPKVFERYVANAEKYVPEEPAPGELLPSDIVELPSDSEDNARDGDHPGNSDSDGDSYRSHRLHLLVALSDVDDAATRSAAAGALAILSNDPQCCRYLFLAHPRASSVLVRLANDLADSNDSDRQLRIAFRHRVAVIWANAAASGDARVRSKLRHDSGVVDTLDDMTHDPKMPYFAAAKDALQKIGKH